MKGDQAILEQEKSEDIFIELERQSMKIPARQFIPDGWSEDLASQERTVGKNDEIELTNLQAWELVSYIQKELYAQYPKDDILAFRRTIYNDLTPKFLEKVNDLKLKDAVTILSDNHKAAKKMVECAKECEALALMVCTEKLRLVGTSAASIEELREIRNYVPIPPTAYISDEQELKSRPNRSQHERLSSIRKEKSAAPKTESEKRIKQIADGMYGGDIDKARQFLASLGGEL